VNWRLGPGRIFPANGSSAQGEPAQKPALEIAGGPRKHGEGGTGGESAPGVALTAFWRPDRRGSRLVVLGAAGSGKTELLVGVLHCLLGGAGADPVPVLVPLTSWDPSQRLQDWLSRWLRSNYRILDRPAPGETRRRLADVLLDEGRLILMLDGFDELAPGVRADALRQINALGDRTALLLSSRPDEFYGAFTLDGASRSRVNPVARAHGIVLLGQSAGDSRGYLERRSLDRQRWAALPDSQTLDQVLATPLMVMLVDAVYNRVNAPDPVELTRFGSKAEAEESLLAAYLPARYAPNGGRRSRWTVADAAHWLGNLAQMSGPRTAGSETPPDLRWWELTGGLARWRRP
jgi:hypothetical protein